MRYLRIFFLYSQKVIEFRAQSFMYFIISLINPLLMIMFWRGATQSGVNTMTGWSSADINSYYLLLIVATGLLIAHVEEEVGVEDIKEGGLTSYLLKPFSYFWIKFIDQISFRILRGLFGITTFIVIYFVFKVTITLSRDASTLIMSALIASLAFMLCYIFKMIISLLAFWVTDIWGIFELMEVILIVFAGNVMPIDLFPDWLYRIATILPFSYMTYFPVIAFSGRLNVSQLLNVIGIQLVWITVLALLYKFLWNSGIKKYSGVSQ